MNTSRKKKDKGRLLRQRRERLPAKLEDLDGELDWRGYCIMPQSDLLLRGC